MWLCQPRSPASPIGIELGNLFYVGHAHRDHQQHQHGDGGGDLRRHANLGAATKQANNVWSYNATGLAEGSHTFAAVATDNLGNASTLTSSPTQIDLVDVTAPVVSTIGHTGSNYGTQTTTDTIQVTASDGSGSGLDTGAVHIYDGTTDLGAATYNAGTASGPRV